MKLFESLSRRTSLTTMRSEGSAMNRESEEPEASGTGELLMVDDSSLDRDTFASVKHVPSPMEGCLYRTCLHPRLSLKNQLFLSFGVVTSLSLFLIVTTAIITSMQAGDTVKSVSRNNLEMWSEQKLAVSARAVAETTTKLLEHFDGMSTIMAETVKDRFAGYPDHPGYEDDSLVPFYDMISERNVYPLKADTLLPLRWEIDRPQLSEAEEREHFQSRARWFDNDTVSTAVASINLRGLCNPAITDPSNPSYYPNCTDANNNITVGGAVKPTSTARLIHQKASDVASPILKAIFEAHSDVRNLGFFFANAGAGMTVDFPAWVMSADTAYISAGCDWMRAQNPFNSSKRIGTEEEIARCYAEGESVKNREYNPLERKWCQEQALDPRKAHNYGPYKDAFTKDIWLMTFGRSVYDRITGEFIACTIADVSVNQIAQVIRQFRITDQSEIAFVRWDDVGTVVASDRWNQSLYSNAISISELGIGVDSKIFNDMKQNFELVYDQGFNPSTSYQPLIKSKGKVFANYPVPVPPKAYDPNYVPEFFIILALDADEIFETVNTLDDDVDETVWEIIRMALIAGSVGFLVVLLCIYLVSLFLTRPMAWMNEVGCQIVQNIGSHDREINFEHGAWLRYSPRTEIFALVQEFQTTVKRFSGHGTARLHTYKGVEVKNPFEMRNNFLDLYKQRESNDFKYNYEKSKSLLTSIAEHSDELADEQSNEQPDETPNEQLLCQIHIGKNIFVMDGDSTGAAPSISLHESSPDDKLSICSSPLFWWTLATITIPLLITMIAISVYVTMHIANELPRLVSAVEEAYVDFEEKSLYPLAKARADFAASVIAPTLRDLNLVSRVAGWVFFGGVTKAESVTALSTMTEACKTYVNDSCPLARNTSIAPCDCRWNHLASPLDRTCTLDEYVGRYQQRGWWFGSNSDAWPNGDVNSTSFPNTSYSPETTSWWPDSQSVPGSELGFNATGSGTVYETILSLSAMAVVQIPVYNYRNTDRPQDRVLAVGGSFFAFDDTGIFAGYSGCDYANAYAATFVSDENTRAALMNQNLCPLGKYGYDPRCRPFYVDAKRIHESGGDPMHVTTPYRFVNGYIGQTAVLPLRNKASDTYLGQVMMDINITLVVEALTQEETPLGGGGFHVLTTTGETLLGRDAIVAPSVDLQYETDNVVSSVLPYDLCEDGVGPGCLNVANFEAILRDMQAGNANATRFTRTTAEGQSEVVFWAYHPVTIHSSNPIDSSDFSRGVETYRTAKLSLALALTEPGVYNEFSSVEEDLDRTVQIATIVLLVVISLTIICVVVVSSKAAISIIKPVSRLLDIVISINKQDLNDDIPEILGGSREVTQVHDTFERLYMVVRFANSAFFSGDLSVAYQTLRSALDLFTKLHNEKAIGVANNNLGNLMLTMYRTMKKTQASAICGLSKARAIENGITYFKRTIDSGEDALARINDEEGWSTNYLVFMQQLSNRYFNRAMFLLSVKENHPDPDEAERQGFADLATAKDMDREVVDNGDNHGFKGDPSIYFELLIGRIKGILNLLAMGYEDEWSIDELFEEASSVLADALGDPGQFLFRNIHPAGQMQRLDATLIEHSLFVGDQKKAALVAIRMLVEDQYVISEPANWAIKALIDYIPKLKGQNLGGVDPSDVQSMLFQYKRNVAERVPHTPYTAFGKSGNGIMMRESAKQSTYGDISMELF